MKLYVNTDTVDIQNRQIGVHVSNGLDSRELCIGVNHNGTKESVTRATKLARLISAAPELLEALESIENDDGRIPATIWELRNVAIWKARGE